MSGEFDTRQHFGPLVNQLYISGLCELDERVWEAFRVQARRRDSIEHGSRDYLIVRMMYVAETTSNAIRMNSTWELIPPAMSLVRDRYEQTVRFSWLVRNPDKQEYDKYERFMIAKIHRVVAHIEAESIKNFAKDGRFLPPWATETIDKEEQAYLEAWDKLDLFTMAGKRDSFPPIANNLLSKMGLQKWYNAVYRQLSSITHYDRFGIEMVHPQQIGDDKIAMGMLPHWPKLLILYTTLLDLIQCYEATSIGFENDTSIQFESLFHEWVALADKLET